MMDEGMQSDLKPLPLSGDRCGPVVGGFMVEVHVGPLHAPDVRQPLQRPLRPHRHRRGHRALRALRLLRHLQRSTLDVETGALQQQLINTTGPLCSTRWLIL